VGQSLPQTRRARKRSRKTQRRRLAPNGSCRVSATQESSPWCARHSPVCGPLPHGLKTRGRQAKSGRRGTLTSSAWRCAIIVPEKPPIEIGVANPAGVLYIAIMRRQRQSRGGQNWQASSAGSSTKAGKFAVDSLQMQRASAIGTIFGCEARDTGDALLDATLSARPEAVRRSLPHFFSVKAKW
jgi:hypothetical protein